MIGHLKGKIITKNPPEVLIEVGGIGYEVLCPMSTFYELDNLTEDVLLFTHLSIKEDAHTLFGFITKDEKSVFRELIRVNGVGPKVALAILSNLSVHSLVECISTEDSDLLAKTPGIGKKTALRLIVELKDRLIKVELSGSTAKTSGLKQDSNPMLGRPLMPYFLLVLKLKRLIELFQKLKTKTSVLSR